MFSGADGGVFEIREYLDDKGEVSGQDVVDITRQLEMLEKIYSEKSGASEAPIDVDEEQAFIRELAVSSSHSGVDDNIKPSQFQHRSSTNTAREYEVNSSSSSAVEPIVQLPSNVQGARNIKAPIESIQKPKTVSSSSSGGWKAGFLNQKKAKARCGIVSPSVERNAIGGEEINDVNEGNKMGTVQSTATESGDSCCGSGGDKSKKAVSFLDATTPEQKRVIPVTTTPSGEQFVSKKPATSIVNAAFTGSVVEKSNQAPVPLKLPIQRPLVPFTGEIIER